jgi:hypothetical protein
MRKLFVVCVLGGSLAAAGCYGGVHVHGSARYRGPNPLAVVATAVAVAAVVHAVSTPPPMAVQVEYYDYGHNPGHVWVNGRYTYVNNQWVWNRGFWQAERSGHYWVQGAWTPQGNQYVWVDGHWAAPRSGYVYVDGYWDHRNTGYVWMPGTWEVDRPGHVYVGGSWRVHNGRRTWSRGGWQRDDGRADWNRYRTRGRATSRASGGVIVRDHR